MMKCNLGVFAQEVFTYLLCSCGHRDPHQQARLTSGGRHLVGNVNSLLPRRNLHAYH